LTALTAEQPPEAVVGAPLARADGARCDDARMGEIVDLLNRPTYGLAQIDSLLGLQGGTARRWIDGYRRGRKAYDPVVREHSTGEEIATWGEFIETRLLAEYRDAGVPMIRMRPAVEALREELKVPYPLASARMWLRPEGRDLARVVQERVGLDSHLALVVVATGQVLAWSPEADRFRAAIEWTGESDDAEPRRLRPVAGIDDVVVDPLLGFGEPVVRGVRTEIIRELVQAGESQDAIADVYELPRASVEAAVRYELLRAAV
jgi:uncharacterized protein (DUF433 family)